MFPDLRSFGFGDMQFCRNIVLLPLLALLIGVTPAAPLLGTLLGDSNSPISEQPLNGPEEDDVESKIELEDTEVLFNRVLVFGLGDLQLTFIGCNEVPNDLLNVAYFYVDHARAPPA